MKIEGSEQLLLENVLDGLDRLYDQKTTAIDLWAICYATCQALKQTCHFAILESTTQQLEKLFRSNVSIQEENGQARCITGDLRIHLCDSLYGE